MAERSIINLQKLEEQLTCPVCLDIYKNPKALPCQHTFCQGCLGHAAINRPGEKRFLNCPSCRKPAELPDGGVSALPPAFLLNSFVELHQEMMSRQDVMECASHNRPLEAFCDSCQELVCFACAAHSHRAHNYQMISEIGGDYRRELEEGIESVQQQLASVMKDIETLSSCDEELARCGELVEQQIRSLAREVKAAVDRKETELVEEVRTAVMFKRGTVLLQKKKAQSEAARLQSSVEFVRQNLNVCSDAQIVASKQQMLKRVSEVIALVKASKLKTMEKADIVFDSNPKAAEEYANIGALRKSTFNYKCLLSCEPVLPGKEAHGKLSLLHTDGYPLPVSIGLLSCQVTSCSDPQPLDCAMQEVGSGKFQFSFTPISQDLHQLRVLFRGKGVPGGMFTVSMMPSSPEARGQPLGTIQGLQYPVDIAASKSGQVIISDSNAHCIVLFDSNLERVWEVGSQGSARNQFNDPNGVAVTDDNCIIVADSSNHRIQVLTMAGQFLKSVGKRGNLPLNFDYPVGVAAIHSSRQILVSEFNNKRIQILNKDFSFCRVFQLGSIIPYSVAEHQGVIYFTDYCNSQIIKMSSSGDVLAKLGCEGAAEGQLYRPMGLAIDTKGFVYVCERKNNRVSVFGRDDEVVRCFGMEGQCLLNSPRGLTIDSNGKLYVCDSRNKRVVIF